MTAKTTILLFLLLAAAAPAIAGTLVWIELPGARASTVRRLINEGLLPWLATTSRRGDLLPIDSAAAARIDSIRVDLRDDARGHVIDIGWQGRPAAGERVLTISSELLGDAEWEDSDGAPSPEMLAAWQGEAAISDFRHIAGLDEALRWEEVLEFASLTDLQTHTLAAMPATSGHPLWKIRHAYAVDRLFANTAIYYGRDRRPERLFLRLALASAYEDDLLPWTASAIAAEESTRVSALEAQETERLFFLRRLRSSAPRLYGRIDRVLQSVQVELGRETSLVVAATRSEDPFIVMAGGPSELRERIARAIP